MSDSTLDRLVHEICLGDEIAWQEFFTRYSPSVERIVRTSKSMGPFRRVEDDVRNVVTAVFSRLHRDNHRALRLVDDWLKRNRGKDFGDWLAIVTTNVIRDYVRAKLGAESKDAPGLKRLVNTLTEALDSGIHRGPDGKPGSTTLQSAQELMSFAAKHLPHLQLEALRDWIEGYDFTEIASRRDMPSSKDAERTIRAAIARLRHHFSV